MKNRAPAVSDLRRYRRRYLYMPPETNQSVEVALVVADHVMHESLHALGGYVRMGGRESEIAIQLPGSPPEALFTLVYWFEGRPYLRLPPWAHCVVYVGRRRYEQPPTTDPRVIRIPFDPYVRAELRIGPMHLFVHYSDRPVVPAGRSSSEERTAVVGSWALAVAFHAMALVLLYAYPSTTWQLPARTYAAPEPSVQSIGSPVDTQGPGAQLQSKEPPNGGIGQTAGPPQAPWHDYERPASLPLSSAADNESGAAATAATPRAGQGGQQRGEAPADEVRTRVALAVLIDHRSTPLGLPTQPTVAMTLDADFGSHGLVEYRGLAGVSPTQPVPTRFEAVVGESSARSGNLRSRIDGVLHLGSSGDPVSTGGEYASVATSLGVHQNMSASAAACGYPPPCFRGESGGYLPEFVRRVVRLRLRELRACYEAELRGTSPRAGEVELEWVIDVTGEVADVHVVRSEFESPSFDSCLVDRVGSWRFTAPTEGRVRVMYPFSFHPSED